MIDNINKSTLGTLHVQHLAIWNVQQKRNVKGSDPVEIPKTVLGFPEHLFEFGKTI